MTVIMKLDLVGPRGRGLAVGLNEFAGYLASAYGLRPEPFYLGVAYVVLGLLVSIETPQSTCGVPPSGEKPLELP